MPSRKLLQINVTANWGSTGRIAEDIGALAMQQGWESHIAYGRKSAGGLSHAVRIGGPVDVGMHLLKTRALDAHGLGSRRATACFIEKIRTISPDIVHLHNIHGYYLNYPLLFDFLKHYGRPVVWTLHDCWAYTGHCAFYDSPACDRWKTGCHDCPQLRSYPASVMADRSCANYRQKKDSFLGVPDLTLVAVSDWAARELSSSFLSGYPIVTIKNGVDLDVFKIRAHAGRAAGAKMVLGVASVWSDRKGLTDFVELRKLLPPEYEIMLVGLSGRQLRNLPPGIRGLQRTDSSEKLSELYNMADVYVNPTAEDNFPTTNIEALACGTPVVAYDTGGSAEAVGADTGAIVRRGDVAALAREIVKVCDGRSAFADACRERAVRLYGKAACYQRYLDPYASLARTHKSTSKQNYNT